MISFSYTIAYVANVEETMRFFEDAFGFRRKMLTGEKDYGELDTGATTLAFAIHNLARSNLPDGYAAIDQTQTPPGIEIALTTNEIDKTHARAISAGAHQIAPVRTKPWGQKVSYVRAPGGMLLSLCTPMKTNNG